MEINLENPIEHLIEKAKEYMINANTEGKWCDDHVVDGDTKYFATAATAGVLKALSEFYELTPIATDKQTEAWLFEIMSEEAWEILLKLIDFSD